MPDNAQDKLTFTKPGVYFDMSFADYLADPSLSASGIKDLLIAPETFYERSPMNPGHERKDTKDLTNGSAYHARVLEGLEAFNAEYAIMPAEEDYPKALKGVKALKAACKDLELKQSGTIEELSERLVEKDPTIQTWHHVLTAFETQNQGKTFISKEWGQRIEAKAQLLHAHPEVRKAITGGYPEVSIFWRDPETGVPMKARIDYLKIKAQMDLKSFTNMNRVPVDLAIARAVANNRYHVQAVVHAEGVEQAKKLIRNGAVFGEPSHIPPNEWMRTFVDTPPHAFIFLFLEKTDVPSIRLKEFPRFNAPSGPGSRTESLAWETGLGAFRIGLNRYKDCMERFGPNTPWIEVPPMDAFCDEDFPVYMMD